jgi:hypothetical protein
MKGLQRAEAFPRSCPDSRNDIHLLRRQFFRHPGTGC